MAEMNKESLQELIRDFTTFLQAIDRVVPDKVDEELIKFLQTFDQHPWLVTMLLNTMNMAKQLDQSQKTKR